MAAFQWETSPDVLQDADPFCDCFTAAQALLQTAATQRTARWYDEAAAGKLGARGPVEKLDAELARAAARQERIKTSLRGLAEAKPDLAPGLERALLRCVAAA